MWGHVSKITQLSHSPNEKYFVLLFIRPNNGILNAMKMSVLRGGDGGV